MFQIFLQALESRGKRYLEPLCRDGRVEFKLLEMLAISWEP